MAKFEFRLDAVKRLREAEQARRRQELAEALTAETLLQAELARLQAEAERLRSELAAASSPGPICVDKLLDARRYELALQLQQKLLADQQAKLQAEIERRRQVLAQATTAVKVLEKLKERRLRQWQVQEIRRYYRAVDELASSRPSATAEAEPDPGEIFPEAPDRYSAE